MKNPVIYTIGLISDTHFQDRLFTLPPTLERYFTGVDLILHAGDVGDLEILDLLSRFAPTIAVHGNDDSDDAKRDLPEKLLVALHGIRILVWHSHYPDPIVEKANRKGVWRPKLARNAAQGREMNAQVVLYGHTHVPIVHSEDGVYIVNPGALAAGNYFLRQAPRTVAKLQIYADGNLEIAHFDVDAGEQITLHQLNLDEEFDRLAERYQEWIIEHDMIAVLDLLQKINYEDIRAVTRSILPLYQQSLQNGLMRQADFIHAIKASNLITPNDKKNILTVMENQ